MYRAIYAGRVETRGVIFFIVVVVVVVSQLNSQFYILLILIVLKVDPVRHVTESKCSVI